MATAYKPARGASATAAGRRVPFDEDQAHAGLILDAYKATPDITLPELQARLADHGTQVALGTIWRFFARRGITRKKTAHATEQDRFR